MNSLADVLRRFNRKERNLLVRAVLGDKLNLTKTFRDEISRELQIESIGEEAWWATDFHISWLAGALAYYTEGNSCLNSARHNPSKVTEKGTECKLIKSNLEDIDLVIASDLDLILIEAKAYGRWTAKQLQSKLDRFDLLRSEYERISAKWAVANPARMHFLLMSPTRPTEINTVDWGTWKRTNSPIQWIPLPLPGNVLEVSLCDEVGKKSAGNYWQIVEHRSNRSPVRSENRTTLTRLRA